MSAMNPQERVKKPESVRTQPIRSWNVLFEPPGGPPSAGAAPPGNPVSQGVEAGYRVVEEYLRQGQNVARGVGLPFSGGTPADDGVQGRMGAMLRSFSDFAGMWMDVASRVGPGGAPGATPPVGTAGPFPVGPVAAEPQGVAPLALTFDIQSARRIEVSVNLHPRSSGLSLMVHELRAPEPDKPRLTGVTLQGLPDEERLVLRLQVPEEYPPGVYSGVILDTRTSFPRGTLSVRIPPP